MLNDALAKTVLFLEVSRLTGIRAVHAVTIICMKPFCGLLTVLSCKTYLRLINMQYRLKSKLIGKMYLLRKLPKCLTQPSDIKRLDTS